MDKNGQLGKWLIINRYGDGYITNDWNHEGFGDFYKYLFDSAIAVKFIIDKGGKKSKIIVVNIPLTVIPRDIEVQIVKLGKNDVLLDVNIF